MMLGWIEDHFTRPVLHFHYFGFSWVKQLDNTSMYVLHLLLIVASIGLMMGWYFRWACLTVFLLFTYFELIDLTYYLNHYYFVSLVALLWCMVPLPKAQNKYTPAWTILIFKAQLAIVYFYAGIAKINYDWLFNALPLKIWLPAGDKLPLIGSLFLLPAMPYIFSWIGMLYDCSIVFFLSNARTRPWAYITVIVFHSITSMLFQIGVFPFVMIGATLIFFSDQWHKKLWSFLASIHLVSKYTFSSNQLNQKKIERYPPKSLLIVFLSGYFAFQILFPWRYLLYRGNIFWTEEGYRFAWRVMLMEKAGTATFYVKDTKTNREGEVDNRDFLNPHQEKQMAMQPDMILQYAQFLSTYYSNKGVYQPAVRAEVYVTLNGKLSQLLIDPKQNLVGLEDGFSQKKWITQHD
jgi:hypothetical protein